MRETRHVHVMNAPETMAEHALEKYFTKIGRVQRVQRVTGGGSGCLVSFFDLRQARRALQSTPHQLGGVSLMCVAHDPDSTTLTTAAAAATTTEHVASSSLTRNIEHAQPISSQPRLHTHYIGCYRHSTLLFTSDS